MLLADPLFWTALAKIIGVNIVLSGDNAVVIALAARSLPPRQQRQAIRWGAGMHASGNLVAAIRTILVADVVMSLDNVIAVAAAAGGDWILLMIGLAISIPLVVFGATLLVKVMERFPVVITIGAALIGFVAGEMAWEDRAIISVTQMHPAVFKYALAALCAAFVVVMGQWLAQRATSRTATSQHQAR